jgi:C4-dicarboxylate-specific signal transduction histidine kinase
MTVATTRWDDLRRITDELQLKIHLAEMDARDGWRELQPQLGEFEHKIADAGGTASASVAHELSELGTGLRQLSGDLVMRLRGNYMEGW